MVGWVGRLAGSIISRLLGLSSEIPFVLLVLFMEGTELMLGLMYGLVVWTLWINEAHY